MGYFVKGLLEKGDWRLIDAAPIARVRATVQYQAQQGASFIFGSDTPSDPTFANPPGLNGRLEIERWANAGVSPRQIFRAATVANANFFRLQEDVGSIAVGKRADMFLTRENPLESTSAYDLIDIVFLAGEPIRRSGLTAEAD